MRASDPNSGKSRSTVEPPKSIIDTPFIWIIGAISITDHVLTSDRFPNGWQKET